jgi:xanthosine utilization system XapX-like protein
MLLIKSLFGSKKFLAMLTGIIGIVALKVFKINLDATTVGEIVGLVAVYIGGQSVADAGKEAAKIEAVAASARNPDQSTPKANKAIEQMAAELNTPPQ